MATLLHSESRRLYSWWWDSHISPKNSKWLQENLTDMDAKVKAMIKLIEEDADSFARRAEMYYKKRPELMKLVEEFYRAYRALAERYNNATGELRQAHRTMAKAFPDQLPFPLADDASSCSESDTPETPRQIRSFFDFEFQGHSATSSQGSRQSGTYCQDPDDRIVRKGLKQLTDIFRSAEMKVDETSSVGGRPKRGENTQEEGSELSQENQKLKSQILGEDERTSKAETELKTIRQALAKLEAERDSIFLQHQETLEKLSNLENDLREAQKDSRSVDKLASEARTEIKALKETLKNIEAERDTTLLQYRHDSERLAAVEGLLSESRKDSKELSERIAEAELESENVKQELARLKAAKEASEVLYKQCLEKIATLEEKLAVAEESLKRFSEDSEKAENEIESLKQEISKVNEERDHVAVQYEKTLQIVSELQHKLSAAQADNSRLNSEMLIGSAKLRDSEDQCELLAKMNESLQLEARSLAQKIAAADEELSQKKAEQDNLMVSLQQEHSRFLQVEATLLALQNLHSQSQEEQRALALELRSGLQMMKDLETCKKDLEIEIHRLKDENYTLSDLNSSSSMSQKNLQEEILRLRDIKEKLEAEVQRHAEQSDVLQVLVHNLKEEIEASVRRYQALVQQLDCVGLDPECFDTAVKGLQDENARLRELSAKDMADREVLLERLQEMEQLLRRNTNLEMSLLEMNEDLQRSKEKAKGLQESFDGLYEEKSSLIAEKSALLSQLQIITETMQNLLTKNMSLQTSLCGATAELEGLRAKSKGLEEFCQFLSSERSSLLAERSSLVSRLEVVEQKLEKLETRFSNLEDKYFGLEMEKHSTLSQVENLKISLDIEKQERVHLLLASEARLSGLEGHIHDLQEESKYRKKEFEDQLEKAVNAQVEIFILQKFVQDMEDKNYDLLVECQRHSETAKYKEKLIAELESENMIQQVEAEVLMDKINSLRAGIDQVLKALEIENSNETESEQNILLCILTNIRNIQCSLSESKDENQQLLVEKSILWTLLGQLHIECMELTSRKTALMQQSDVLTQQLLLVENEKRCLVDTSRQLNMEIIEREKREEALKAAVKNLQLDNSQLKEEYFVLQEENINFSEQNRCLELDQLHTKEEKRTLEEQNSLTLAVALACHYQCVIFESYGTEADLELKKVIEDMNSVRKSYMELEDKATGLEERLLGKEIENLALRASLKSFEEQWHELNTYTDQLRLEVSDGMELLIKRNCELAEVNTKLKATEDINTDLCCTIRCLEKDHEGLQAAKIVSEKNILDLSEQNQCQEKQIVHLREANENLELEVDKLHEEIQECKIREVILTSELHEKSNEFELWEAEAASFYFDLQISSIREVLYQNKVLDLGNLCEGLGEVTNHRSVEIERMKQRVVSLETEAEALKSQLTTCLPLIASLKDSIALLEKNPILQSQLHAVITSEEQEKCVGIESSSTCSQGLSELQKLHDRIKVIEDILNKEKEVAATQERHNAEVRLEAALKDIEDLKAQMTKNKQEEHRNSAQDSVSDTSDFKFGAEMKDIPLDQASGRSLHGRSQRGSAASDDQMLELWEAAEQDSSNDNFINEVQEHGTDTIEDEIVYTRCGSVHQISYDPTPESQFMELGVNKSEVQRRSTQMSRKRNQNNVLERLETDAQKLTSLQVSVQEFKRTLESNTKRKKAEDTEYKTIKSQLESTGNSVAQLIEMNTELIRTIEESSMTTEAQIGEINETESVWQKRVLDQAQREAEKINNLELEMKQMQYGLLRLRDEKSRAKDGTSRSSAAVLLRKFFYSREWKSTKPKKARFCGCLRPTIAKN